MRVTPSATSARRRSARAHERRREEHDHHHGERPEREGPDELARAESGPECECSRRRPPRAHDHARREPERERAEEHRHRLRVHHRRRSRGEHAEREQPERGRRQEAAARKDEKGELEHEQSGHEQQHAVDELGDPEWLPEPRVLPHPDRGRGHHVEAGRHVVLADAVGKTVAVEDALGVCDVILGVVAEPWRVLQHVPRGDEREHDHEGDRYRAVPGDHAVPEPLRMGERGQRCCTRRSRRSR